MYAHTHTCTNKEVQDSERIAEANITSTMNIYTHWHSSLCCKSCHCQDKEHLPAGKQGILCGTLQAVNARTKNTYLRGNRAFSVVHYRLSMPGQRTPTCRETGQSLWYTTGCQCQDKEQLPAGKQGSLCGTLQAVNARTKNTYLRGNRAVSVVHYRLSMPGQRTPTCGETGQSLWYTTGCQCQDKEQLPAGTQGGLSSRLQAVTVLGQWTLPAMTQGSLCCRLLAVTVTVQNTLPVHREVLCIL